MELSPRDGEDERITSPATLPIQPVPTDVCVLHEFEAGKHSTRIARVWSPGDAARCQLCPAGMCGVSDKGLCLVKIPGYVPDNLAACIPFPPLPGRRIDRIADSG